MERRLIEAAVAGNVSSLLDLLKEDELILDRIMVTSVTETPLHIASMLGHLDFAREILSRKPELASKLNSQGSSALHLASAKGHLDLVKLLLDINPEACLLSDQEGRTPLHVAVIEGRVGVMNEIINAKPESTQQLTGRKETILHLCVKYSQFEAMKFLWVNDQDGQTGKENLQKLISSKDDDGNTLLHLSAAKKETKMMKFLLIGTKRTEVDMNAMNVSGLTALDILLHCRTHLDDIEIIENLRKSGAKRAQDMYPETRYDPNILLVVAVLLATMTFEAGLNPPGNNCELENKNTTCSSCRTSEKKICPFSTNNYSIFMIFDATGFLASLSIIILIISGLHIKRRVMMLVLMSVMWIAIMFVGLVFAYYVVNITHDGFGSYFVIIWLVLLALFFIFKLVRLGLELLRKYRIIGEWEAQLVSDADLEKGRTKH